MSDLPGNVGKATILIIDETPSDSHPLGDYLASKGYDLHFAASILAVINVAGDTYPDLILVEVELPQTNGFEVCEKLKADKSLKNIPVILIAPSEEQMDRARCFAAGGADYILRPLEFEEVRSRVKIHLDESKLKKQLELTSQELVEARSTSQQLLDDLDGQVRQRTIELEEANKSLRDIKAQFEAVYNHHYQLTGLIDKDGRLLMGNRIALKMAGVQSQDVVGKYFWDTPWWSHSKKTQHFVRDAMQQAMKGEMVQFDTTHISANGEKRDIDFRIAPVFDDNDELIYLVPEGYDITERKQIEEALRMSRAWFHRIVNNAVVGFYQVTFEGTFLLVNRKFAQMFGYLSPDKFLNSVENIGQLYVDPEERPLILKEIDTRGVVDDAEIKLRNKNGQIILVRASIRVFQDQKIGVVYEGVMADITEQKKAEQALQDSEEKLARSRKMESLGLLASGVAHDLNNVLAGVVAYPELLLMELPPDSKLKKPIQVIQDSGNRAVAIVQDLLTVARGVAIAMEPLDLNEIVTDYFNSPEFKKLEQFHPSVKLEMDLERELLNMRGSSIHLRKILMNLVANAMEASTGVGQVTVSTQNRYLDRPMRGYDNVKIGEYTVLVVTDNGPGIPADDLERIFEPFYTKKVMGRSGTGLGLAVVWNTVQDHKGYIDVTSDEGGTRFELFFPMTREEFVKGKLSIPIDEYRGNGETILVIDDVESQREITCRMLNKLGYQAIAVPGGEEAVVYLRSHTVDLLLLDMIMEPGINGRETYDRIIKINQKQKAIIISGFAETEEVKKTQQLGAGNFVRKPFNLARIGLAVKKELAR